MKYAYNAFKNKQISTSKTNNSSTAPSGKNNIKKSSKNTSNNIKASMMSTNDLKKNSKNISNNTNTHVMSNSKKNSSIQMTRYLDKLTELKNCLKLQRRPSPMSLYNIGKKQAIEIWKDDPNVRAAVIEKLDDMFLQ